MCARYALSLPLSFVAELFGWSMPAALAPISAPRYRVVPSQRLALVQRDVATGGTGLGVASWGWPRARGGAQINVRVESVRARSGASIAAPLRCLVPMTGWIEWTGSPGARTTWYLTPASGDSPLLFARALRATPDPDAPVAILTMPPLPSIAAVHDRMPSLTATPDDAWLLGTDAEAVAALADARVFDALPPIGAREVAMHGGTDEPEGPGLLEPPAQARLWD
jgi:putative SOS response-associated peptidase YedK